MLLGRESLPPGALLYYSAASHYSLRKAAMMLQVRRWPVGARGCAGGPCMNLLCCATAGDSSCLCTLRVLRCGIKRGCPWPAVFAMLCGCWGCTAHSWQLIYVQHLRNAQVPAVEVGTLPSGEIDYGELQQKLEANRQAGRVPRLERFWLGILAAGRYRCWELWSEHGASAQATV